jgi:hypothetical protein
MRSSSLALAVALPAPAPSFAQDADDIGQGCERKVKKAKRLIGRSVVHGQIAVPEGFRYIFWGDRHHRRSAHSGRYGLGTHPGSPHTDGGPRGAGSERISGHRPRASVSLSVLVLRDIPNSRHTSDIDSPSSRRPTKRRRSSITELAFHGIYTSRVKSAGKCDPCVRYEMELMSRAAHIGYKVQSRSGPYCNGTPIAGCTNSTLPTSLLVLVWISPLSI